MRCLIQNVIDLYNHRKVPKKGIASIKAFTIFVCNLKGGGSRQFDRRSSRCLPAYPQLLFEDLRILGH